MDLLVPFHLAKDHAEMRHNYSDELLESLLLQAQHTSLDFLKNRISGAEEWAATIDGWTQETVPPDIAGAILRQFTALVRFRGDDDDGVEPKWIGGLHPLAYQALMRYRDQALA